MAIQMKDKRYGKLLVLELAGKDKRGELRWLCQCDCGNRTTVLGSHLRSGAIVSCGCVMRTTHKTHGMSKTRVYRIWQKMKSRCYNKNDDHYKDYGMRGIIICESWLSDFMNFYRWAMNNGYEEHLTIDRIDFNGNYVPSNCRWIPQTEQPKNTRKAVLLEHDGETHTLREWARIKNIPKSTFQDRYRRGVDIFG